MIKDKTTWFGKLLNILDILVIIICLVSIVLFIYLKWLAPEKVTEMVTYMSPLETTDGRECVVKVSYYENKDKSGEELFEVKLSGYTDTNAKEITSFGVQIIGDFKKLAQLNDCSKVSQTGFLGVATKVDIYYSFLGSFYGISLGRDNSNAGKLFFYSETDNLSYKNVDTSFDDFGYIRLKYEDKVYAFQFGYENNISSQFLWQKNYRINSFSSFVKNLYEKVKTTPTGQFNTTFGFKDMFKVYEYKNNQYENITNQDDVYNYCYVDVTHYTTGAKTANDSIFSQVKYSTNWTYGDASLLDEHFSDKSIYYLSQNDCKFEYDNTLNKHLFDITDNCYNSYKNKKQNYELIIDLDYLNSINIAFGGVKQTNRLSELGITKYYTKTGDILQEVVL